MQQSSLVKWVDELQAQIDQVKRAVESIPAPPAPPTTYTRETVFEGEEVTAESGALVEEFLPTGTVYVFIKLYTMHSTEKLVRYTGIFDAADFSGELHISLSDILQGTPNVEALYQVNVFYSEAGFLLTADTIIPEGAQEKDVFMDLYAFTTDEQPTTATRKTKNRRT